MTVQELHRIIEPDYYPTITVHWLHELLKTDMPINYGHYLPRDGICTSKDIFYSDYGNAVKKIERNDISLLVGADGQTSKGRTHAFYTGQNDDTPGLAQ